VRESEVTVRWNDLRMRSERARRMQKQEQETERERERGGVAMEVEVANGMRKSERHGKRPGEAFDPL